MEHPQWFLGLGACGLATSFTSTLMFTSLGAFFNRISDPGMGGAYLTLLNTIANMGELLLLSCPCAQPSAGLHVLSTARMHTLAALQERLLACLRPASAVLG